VRLTKYSNIKLNITILNMQVIEAKLQQALREQTFKRAVTLYKVNYMIYASSDDYVKVNRKF